MTDNWAKKIKKQQKSNKTKWQPARGESDFQRRKREHAEKNKKK